MADKCHCGIRRVRKTTMYHQCNKKHENWMHVNCCRSKNFVVSQITYKCYWNVINWAELAVKAVECVKCTGNILSADAAVAESSYQFQLFHGVQGGRCHRAVYRCRHCLCTASSKQFSVLTNRNSSHCYIISLLS